LFAGAKKKIMKKFLAYLSCAVLTIGSPANILLATDYFVDVNAAPGGDGSASAPWNSIAESLDTWGGSPVIAGDVIHVASGVYDDNNGDWFPLRVPAGVSIVGPGDHSAILDSSNQPFAGTVLDLHSIDTQFRSVIDGLSIHTNGYGSAMDIDKDAWSSGGGFELRNNHISGVIGNLPAIAVYGGNNVIIDSNITTNCVRFLSLYQPREQWPLTVEVTNNQHTGIVGTTAFGVGIDVGSRDLVSLAFANNTISNTGGVYIGVDVSDTTGTIYADIDNNTIEGNLDVEVTGTDDSAYILADYRITNNTVSDASTEGILFSVGFRSDSSSAIIAAHIAGNTVDNSAADGIKIRVASAEDGVDTVLTVLQNHITGSGGEAGLNISTPASVRSGTDHVDIYGNVISGTTNGTNYGAHGIQIMGERGSWTLRGNTVTGNDGSGLLAYLGDAITGSSSRALSLNLGTQTDPGLNSFHSNGATAPGAEAINLGAGWGSPSPQVAGIVIPAYGNDWNTTNLATIEDMIWHHVDDPVHATVEFDAPASNGNPVAVDDSAATDFRNAVTVDVLANDTDPDGDALTIDSVTSPANGSAIIVAGQVEYTPDEFFAGQDSFSYTVSDGFGGTDTANVDIAVQVGVGALTLGVNNAAAGATATFDITGGTPITNVLLAYSTTGLYPGDSIIVLDRIIFSGTTDMNGNLSNTFVISAQAAGLQVWAQAYEPKTNNASNIVMITL